MEIPSLTDLMAMTPEQLAQTDLALMNLVCATGLPGAEKLNPVKCLATLDSWTCFIHREMRDYLPVFQRNAIHFHFCEGFFQMQVLVTIVKRDLGAAYNPRRANDEPFETFFANSCDLFIHGLLVPPHFGTCASMPVLITTLARRLNYPVKLVTARGHVFARWEDDWYRFNVEASNDGGMVSHSDRYYLQGTFQASPNLLASEGYLKSLTHEKALALFLGIRADCLQAHKRFAEAVPLLKKCLQIHPTSQIYKAKLDYFLKQA